jgi:hypothetical protein
MTNSRPNLPLAALAVVTLIGTILWVVLMIASGPPPHTFEQALFKVSRFGVAKYQIVGFYPPWGARRYFLSAALASTGFMSNAPGPS